MTSIIKIMIRFLQNKDKSDLLHYSLLYINHIRDRYGYNQYSMNNFELIITI